MTRYDKTTIMNMTMKKTIYALAVAIAYATAANAQEPLPAEWHLDECIKYAQEHSIEVQQSKLQYETSRSTLRVNQLSMTPSVSASVGQTFSFGRATGRDNVIINQSQASTSFGANASMPIFTGLRITNQIKSSKLNLQAALADIENAEDNVALNIAAQYLQVLYNQELVKISREQYEQSEELVEKTRVLVEQGKTSESELYENRAQMMQYAQTLTESENSLSLSVVDLCQMMNYNDVESFVLADVSAAVDALVEQGVMLISPSDAYAYSLDNHPALKAMGLRLQSAQSDIKVAQSGYYPELSLAAGYSTGYYHLFNATANTAFGKQLELNGSEMVGLSLSIPIYNRLSVREQVKQYKITAKLRELDLLNSQQSVFKSIQTAYYNAKAAQDKLKATMESEEAGRIAFEFEKTKYENGSSTTYDYSQAEMRWRNAQMQAAQAKYELILRTKILDYYMGRDITL